MAKQLIDILIETGKVTEENLKKAQLHAKQNNKIKKRGCLIKIA